MPFPGSRSQLLRVLGSPDYRPLNATELSGLLQLEEEESDALEDLIARLEEEGVVVRLRPDRIALREALTLRSEMSDEPESSPVAEPQARGRPDRDADHEIALQYGLRIDFPDRALAEASEFGDPDSEKLDGREDCRGAFVFTIDPDDARDFDDAIGVERLEGGWRLTVHIADVSHYVEPGTALDREALKRGNSVYLATRVIPMLPERLSNELCSLRPGESRLTVFARLTFSDRGEIRETEFGRGIIRSQHRLTYRQAYAILEGGDSGLLPESLREAAALAKVLRQRRVAAGALDFDFPEAKIRMDADQRPIAVEIVQHDLSHQLIEEFMLAANEAVAKFIRERPLPTIYRVHENPDPEKLAEFRELAGLYGIRCGDLTNRSELTKLLEKIHGHPSERMLKYALLRSLRQAAYDPRPLGHFGLAKANYTHFTSPIRRYADLVVHRSLLEALGKKRGRRRSHAGVPQNLAYVAEHVSTMERVAQEAERESVQRMKLLYLQGQIDRMQPESFKGIVVEVIRSGLLVELPDLLLTGLLPIGSLRDDFYRFDAVRREFSGMRRRKTYRIGDELEVMVARVDFSRNQVDFHPV